MFFNALLIFVLSTGPLLSTATVCYTCDNYDHPRDCVHVTKCSANQECFVESNVTQTGRLMYNSGCMDSSECSAILRPRIPGDMIVGKRSGTVCKLCCHDDYCNSEICDLPGVDKTGPRCLSCNDAKLDRPQDCLSITQCAKDEICYTEKIGQTYRMGCIVEKDCKLTVNKRTSQRYSRTTASCAECCDNSYCNAELCGNTSLVNPNFNVFTMSTSPTSKPISGTCDDSSYEACQYFIHSKNDSCQDVNMQRICPKSCGICDDKTCIDNATFDCAVVDRSFNICQNLKNARHLCRKHCGYCNYVNGGWTSWSDWSACSRSCNYSIQTRTRTCTNPAPKNDGDPCQGNNKETQQCKSICGGQFGNKFILSFPEGYTTTTEIQVLIVSLDDGTVNITSDEPGGDRIVSITSNKGLTLSLPVTLVKTGSYIGRKTVTVESSIDIAVFVAILGSSGTGDGYMAVPIKSLQKKYFFSADRYIRLSVVSFYDNTEISFIRTSGTAINLNRLRLSINSNITMSRGQNLQVREGSGPMGYVTGSKPFMFLQGSHDGSYYSKYVYSFTDSVFFTAANLYIIPYLYNGTEAVTFCNRTGSQPAKSDRQVFGGAEYLYINVQPKVSYIKTDFLTSCQYIGHGFSITVPSVSSYTTYCRFLTPYQQRFSHHSAVLIKTEYDSEVKFMNIGNGHVASPNHKEVVTVEGVSYSALYYTIDPGQYEVYNGNPNATLTVISYGFGKGIQAAYGYPVCFKKI